MECGDSSPLNAKSGDESPLDAKSGDESPHSTTSGLQLIRLRNISLLVPKLPLGNGVFQAPASRRTAKQELAR